MNPLHFVGPHSLLNIESLVALGFISALLWRSRGTSTSSRAVDPPVPQWTVYAAICAAIFLVYRQVLDAPFLYDDYTHITDARRATFGVILEAFGPVENPPGLFFRPFGFLVYWLNYLAVGPDPRWWHAVSLAFHSINACLLLALARTLRLGFAGALGAALLFAFSGSAVEPAAWIDARFDPMATLLVLASLLCLCRYVDLERRVLWLATSCILAVAACCSKESAFCLPLLAACLWLFRDFDRRRMAIGFVSVGATATAVFLYRYWALGGIGGYRGAAGDSNIESFSLVRMLNAVLVRDWTILFFPVNWSGDVNLVLAVMLLLTPLALAVGVWKGGGVSRRAVIGAVLMTLVSALPVQHLLLIGVDLANTRYVYLLSAGWALLFGAVFAGIRWRWWVMGWMVILHLLIGQHNLGFWLRVHEEARSVCIEFGRKIEGLPGNAVVGPLPQRKDGVVFLANGFPECVEMNAHVPEGRVSMFGSPGFVWDPGTGRVEAVSTK